MSDVSLLSRITGLSFDSPFLSSLLLFVVVVVVVVVPSPLALFVLSFFLFVGRYHGGSHESSPGSCLAHRRSHASGAGALKARCRKPLTSKEVWCSFELTVQF